MQSQAPPIRLASERVVVAAPLSFAGSAARIWKIASPNHKPLTQASLSAVALCLIVCAWSVVLAWYVCFSVLLVPYRITRRGQRKRVVTWFDFTGSCPLCGKSLVSAQDEHASGPTRHVTCGGFKRHRWLVYYRQAPLRRVTPTRMRSLKALDYGAVSVVR